MEFSIKYFWIVSCCGTMAWAQNIDVHSYDITANLCSSRFMGLKLFTKNSYYGSKKVTLIKQEEVALDSKV